MDRRCDRCGRDLLPGDPAWILRLEAYADFDGTLWDLDEEMLEAELQGLLAELEEAAAGETAATLEEEVYLKRLYRLCRACRDRWTANPLNAPLPGRWE
ncbi:MAG TPA: hypothetical protein VFV36_01570 [Candidatus Methylomirabilis sp.]|nr:hypothetical protein [Candidatus Methylomirabilis sp.]